MNARTLAPIALAALFGFLTACGASFPRSYTFSRTMAPIGAAVDVENNKGRVKIVADSGVDEITVNADVHVAQSVDKEKREGVAKQVRVVAAMETDGPRPVLRVRSESPRPDAADHSVDLLIRMPVVTGVLVRNSGGHVILEGVSGAVQVENVGGSIELRTPRRLDEPVALITDTGNVWLQAPVTTTGQFELRSDEGVVSFDSAHVLPQNVYSSRGVYRAVLNDGANDVLLRTGEGKVRVYIQEEPMKLVRFFK